jgi:16S rRNA (guanine527-N7)-methyltransferase
MPPKEDPRRPRQGRGARASRKAAGDGTAKPARRRARGAELRQESSAKAPLKSPLKSPAKSPPKSPATPHAKPGARSAAKQPAAREPARGEERAVRAAVAPATLAHVAPAPEAARPPAPARVDLERGPQGARAGTTADAPPSAAAAAGSADPDAVVVHRDTPLPDAAALLEAMRWAFQAEEIDPRLVEAYARHAALVLEGNRSMNLTAIVDPREVAAKHYLDCWRVTRLVPLMGRSLADVGSGAGFPGVPIAMADPNVRVTLLDSTKKRMEFAGQALERMGLKNVSAVWTRAEDWLARNRVDAVVMRAVSSVRENVRVLRKVRHSHKDLVMLKGPSWSRELRAGEREVERLGYKLDTVWEHELPGELGARAILVFRAPGGQGL